MLPLTFSPPTLNGRPLSKTDYDVFEDGDCIGRVYEVAWFWTITALTPNPRVVLTSGHAATFEDAKAQFRDHWWRAWNRAPA